MNTRATIRFVEEADAEALFEAARSSRAELAPWMPWCHADYCIEESRQWLTQEVARRVDASGYAVGGLDAAGFRARDGRRAGRLKGGRAAANGLAVTGRLEYEATLGLVAGVSGYVGQAGPNADFYDPTGERVELKVPVWGASADIRGRHEGLEFRGVFATFGIGDTVTLRDVADQEGENLGLDVPAQIYGGYLELGYDLLTLMSETEQQLLPFVRFERYDTMAEVAGRQEVPSDRAFGVNELFLGFSYRPLRQVVFKGDFMLRMPDGAAPDGTSNTRGDINLGMGVMF